MRRRYFDYCRLRANERLARLKWRIRAFTVARCQVIIGLARHAPEEKAFRVRRAY